MRELAITRAEGGVASMSDLFLSLTTGLILTLQFNYYVPLLQNNNYALASILSPLVVVTAARALLHGAVAAWRSRASEERALPVRKLVYTVAVKVGGQLCLAQLLVAANGVAFALALLLTLVFVLSMQECSQEGLIGRLLWKGRSLGNRPKTFLVGLLVAGSLGLQPLSYWLTFDLHFEVFLVLASSLVFFSYYYLHKLLLALTPKQALPRLAAQMAALECLLLLILAGYCLVMGGDEGGNAGTGGVVEVCVLCVVGWVYEAALLEAVKKVAVSRLMVTQVTGLLWFNVYSMWRTEIDLRHYISAIILFSLLLLNIGLFSHRNMTALLALLTGARSKRRTTLTEIEIKDSDNDR